MTFGEKLRTIREGKDLSLSEFAAILGTSKQVLSRYELGQNTPKITTVQQYAKILNVPLAYLTDDDKENSGATFSAASSHTSFIDHDPLIDEIVFLLSEATPEQLASVIRYIKFTLQDG